MFKPFAAILVTVTVLPAPAAHAVILKNTDREAHRVHIEIGGKKGTIKLAPGRSYDTKGRDVKFILNMVPSSGKADEQYLISGGKIVPDMDAKKEADMAPYENMMKKPQAPAEGQAATGQAAPQAPQGNANQQ